MNTTIKHLSLKSIAWLLCWCLLVSTMLCLPVGAEETNASLPTNIALEKEAWASSNDRGDHTVGARTVRFLTDGVDTNFIVSHEEDAQPWFYVDLGQSYCINRVELCWGGTKDPYTNAYATRYALQISHTGADDDWQTVLTVADGALEDRTLTFDGVDAQFVRIAVEEKAGTYAALREMRVFEAAVPDIGDGDQDDTGEEEEPVRVLFIGNSHTYKNNVPQIVADLCAENNQAVDCDSLAIESLGVGGKTLEWHYEQGRTALTIMNGHYDYVVLQENASLFNDATFTSGYALLRDVIRRAGAQPLLYMIWSNESKPAFQKTITKTYVREAQKSGAKLAAAGVVWDILRHNHPEVTLYQADGNHATPTGSYLAASSLFYAITEAEQITVSGDSQLIKRLGVSVANANLVQETAFRVAQEGYGVVKLLNDYDPKTDNETAPDLYPALEETPVRQETLMRWSKVEATYDTLQNGKRFYTEWKTADGVSNTGVDLSGQAVNGANLDYDLTATVTLTPLGDTKPENIGKIWRTMTFWVRSGYDGGECKSDEFTVTPAEFDGENTFTIRIPLLAIGTGKINWADVREILVRCELNGDYYQLNEDGSEPASAPCPYFTLQLESVQVVNTNPAYILGDTNLNGKVDAEDALMALQAATEKIILTADEITAADVDGNAGVTVNDALNILQYATRKIDKFSVEG